MQNQNKREITFDTQLKIALQPGITNLVFKKNTLERKAFSFYSVTLSYLKKKKKKKTLSCFPTYPRNYPLNCNCRQAIHAVVTLFASTSFAIWSR